MKEQLNTGVDTGQRREEGLLLGPEVLRLKSANNSNGPSCQRLSQFLLHEESSISLSVPTPPPSLPQMGCYFTAGVPPNVKLAGTHLYPWEERGTARVVSCPRTLPFQTTQYKVKCTSHKAIIGLKSGQSITYSKHQTHTQKTHFDLNIKMLSVTVTCNLY